MAADVRVGAGVGAGVGVGVIVGVGVTTGVGVAATATLAIGSLSGADKADVCGVLVVFATDSVGCDVPLCMTAIAAKMVTAVVSLRSVCFGFGDFDGGIGVTNGCSIHRRSPC